MSLEWLGDIGIIVSVIATTAFIIGYVFLAPFYRTAIGWSLLASKSWICLLSWFAFLRTTLEISDDSLAVQILRVVIWIGLPVISVSTFWVLLVRGQVISHRRRVRRAPEEVN